MIDIKDVKSKEDYFNYLKQFYSQPMRKEDIEEIKDLIDILNPDLPEK